MWSAGVLKHLATVSADQKVINLMTLSISTTAIGSRTTILDVNLILYRVLLKDVTYISVVTELDLGIGDVLCIPLLLVPSETGTCG